jgi:tripartite-type tricarboxylate transporter receptor subunit TctC
MRLVAAAALASCAPLAHGQPYPVRPIRIIVPWPAGGSADILGRITGQRLGDALGQPVVIENRGGASGNIGTEAFVRSPPDGYTVLFGSMSTHAMNQFLYPRMTYDPVADIVPVSLVASVASVLAVHPSLPARGVKDLLALARARPGRLNFASGSSVYQLCGELLKLTARVDLVHIPYKGGAQAITDLIGGQVEMLFTGAPNALPHHRAGKLHVLAVTNMRRANVLPDVPTIGETLAGYAFDNWNGVMLPVGTPRAVVDRLNAEIARVLSTADVRERFLALGADPSPGTPEQFGAVIRADAEKAGRLIKAAGLRAEP